MDNLSLKLVVDKEEKRVLFAASDRRFVEMLLSFLTLPLGTVVRLLGKHSTVGCLDKLYEGVEHLDTTYLQTSACKAMLLQPRSAAEIECEDLLKGIDDLNPKRFYRCKYWEYFINTHSFFSMVPGSRCHCGQPMENVLYNKPETYNISSDLKYGGVFLKGAAEFLISDDLHVTPASTGDILSYFPNLVTKDLQHSIEEKTLQIGKTEILKLLRRSLLSKTPLTDVFLGNPASIHGEAVDTRPIDSLQINPRFKEASGSKRIALKLLLIQGTDEVVFAEAGNDLVDLLFSFLTFPLGSVVKLLGKHSSTGCAVHLYSSVEGLSNGGHMRPERKTMLLDPKLAPYHGCSNQLLKIDEMAASHCNQLLNIDEMLPSYDSVHDHLSYYKQRLDSLNRLHGGKNVLQTLVNPKLLSLGQIRVGGGFADSTLRFMVTNEMVVMPLSSTSVLQLIKDSKVPLISLVEKEVTIGEAEALKLLKACLTSKKLVAKVFSEETSGGN